MSCRHDNLLVELVESVKKGALAELCKGLQKTKQIMFYCSFWTHIKENLFMQFVQSVKKDGAKTKSQGITDKINQ